MRLLQHSVPSNSKKVWITDFMNTLLLGNNKKDIEQASKLLRDGEVVAIPTETVYGLAANALDPDAVKKIFEAKGRPMDNPLIVHIGEIEDIKRFNLVTEFSDKAEALAKRFWPGPLTMIMKRTDIVPKEVSAGLDTVAIRLPSNEIAREIISGAGIPLAAPSANKSGSVSPTTAQHVMADMDGDIAAIVDGGQSDVGVESTVITLATDTVRLLRPGYITVEQIEEVVGHIEVDKAVLLQLEKDEQVSSPGMKYKHYSPKAKVVLLKGSSEQFVHFVNAKHRHSFTVCAICYDEEQTKINAQTVTIGKEADIQTQVHKLFEALRRVDTLSNVQVAYAHCPDTQGLSMALYNRLIRAAGFDVVDLDNKPLVVGLTGPSGAGKGEVAKVFVQNGYAYIDADILAREVVCKGSDTLMKLRDAFSDDILCEDDTLDRKALAKIAFSTKENTQLLNSIIHPAIVSLVKAEIDRLYSNGYDKIVYDAPTLFESQSDSLCDVIVSVMAEYDSRLERIMSRDKLSEVEAKLRLSAQQKPEFYTDRSDYVIDNNTTHSNLVSKSERVVMAIDEVHNGTL